MSQICLLTPELEASQRALHDAWPGDAEPRPFCYAFDLLRGAPCLVPFERVAVGLTAELEPRVPYHDQTFTGAAAHVSFAEAVLHGTVEVIKRDAFLIAWYRRRRLRPVSWPDTISKANAARAQYLRAHGLELELFDLTHDIPLCLLLLRVTATRALAGWPAGGALLVPAGGFAAGETLEHALKLAATRFVSLCHSEADARDPCDPVDIAKHSQETPFWPLIARYLDPQRAAALAFLGTSGSPPLSFHALPAGSLGSPGKRLQALRRWLSQRELAWTAVRLTDATAQATRREVARVIMPQLLRLTAARETVDLDSARLRMELADAELDQPNLDPHPLY